MELNKLQLILASKSPRRKELLGYLNIPFQIDASDIEEISNHTDPKLFCEDIAAQKGRTLFQQKIRNSHKAGNSDEAINIFVISSDTIVFLDGIIYGKPKNREDAKRILLELSGKTHTVFTAVSFFFHDPKSREVRAHSFSESTEVTFQEISLDLLEAYLDTGDSLDKAGAYGIQGPSLTFISSLVGSYSNVVGFPLNRVVEEMRTVLFLEDNETLRSRFV